MCLVALIIFFTDFQFSLWETQIPQDCIYIKHTVFADCQSYGTF